MKNRTSVRRRLLFAVVVVGALLGSSELGCRLLLGDTLRAWAGAPPQTQGDAAMMKGNPYLLWELSPGQRDQRGYDITINSRGLRSPELSVPKPEGRRRLVTVGDSSVFGDGVGSGEVFGERCVSALGPSVELINASVPGYSTYQSLNLLRMRVMELQPDLLVIASLWSDNNFDSFVDRQLLSAYAAFGEGWSAKLRRRASASAIFRVIDWQLRVRRRAERVHTVGFTLGSEHKLGPRRVAIQDYADNLDTMVDLGESRHAEVIFLLLANAEDLQPPGDQPPAWEPYRQVMRDTAERRGAQLVDVPRLFKASGQQSKALFVDQLHPSALGHQLIGRELAQLLAQADWVHGGALMGQDRGGPVPHYKDPALHPPAREIPVPRADR